MKKNLLLIISIILTTFSFAQMQKGEVTTAITNEKTEVEAATAELLKSSDSSLVKTALSDKAGLVVFENINAGSYLLRVSLVGYATQYSPLFTVTESQAGVALPAITLTAKAATQLQGVTVTAKKPFIQKLNDRLVVNVEGSIVSTGSTAMDVLERSPGITIDQNDNISLRGKSGVIIMVDGKVTPMSGTDLANYLKGMPSGTIERIDIITNPSAKYDAAGNSGIIDIHLKKDQRFGANGTFTAGFGQGVYPKANTGATFNYRNKKINFFGNYNYAYREQYNNLVLRRDFFNNGKFSSAYDQDNNIKLPFQTHAARIGADFFPSKKNIIGVVVNSNFFHVNRTNNNSSIVIGEENTPVSSFVTSAWGKERFNNTVGNINFKHTFDSTGKELTADADYGVFTSNGLSNNHTNYYHLNGNKERPDYILNGDQTGKLTIKSAKADYTNPLKHSAKLEAGLKWSFVSSDNDALFYDYSSGTAKYDSGKSNHFLYQENNNAAYVNYSKEFKKFNLQLGLRGEQTNYKGRQAVGNVSFDSSYLKLFPSMFFNYKLKENQTIGVSVSRRIDRPSYNQLNPFLFLLDVSTYSTGNPYLKPQFTWSYELSYTLKQLNIAANYSHTIDDITNVVSPDLALSSGQNKVTVQSPRNLSTHDHYGFTVAAPVKIASWWNMINNGNVYYNYYNAFLANTALNKGGVAWDMSSNNTFTFKKGWTSELNFNYNSKALYDFFTAAPRWQLSAGVQKSILQNKGTLRLNVTDIFLTNLGKGVIQYTDYYEQWHANRDSRVATLTFTYRFGNNKVAAARRRTTASEEETRRAGN